MKSPRSPAARRQMHLRLDRHSGTGTRGLPKKNGAGGKTVWGSAMDQAPIDHLDKNDPNYDSDEEMLPPDFSLSPPSVIPGSTAKKSNAEGNTTASIDNNKPKSTPGSGNNSPNTSNSLPSPEATD